MASRPYGNVRWNDGREGYDMVIRDPVHGDIPLTKELQLLLDSPEMQRLRGVKQLGTAYLVFPGALHTRFDHALGTVAMAGIIMNSLQAKSFSISPEEKKVVLAAALLHDLTHIPFGHTFEDERRVFSRHDTPARFRAYLGAGGVSRVLDRLGLAKPVLELLTGQPPRKWMASIVAGTIDADLLDYLRRDGYFTGLSQHYDDRVFQYFSLEDDELVLDMTKAGLDRPDARSETVNLLRLRYFLTERVYYHHAKVVAGAMISKAIEATVEAGLREEKLYGFTDDGLFRYLEGQASSQGLGPGVAELVSRVRERRLYKRAYVLSEREVGPEKRSDLIQRFQTLSGRKMAERALATELGLSDHEVIIYCPDTPVLKEATVRVRTTDGLFSLDDPRLTLGREVRFLQGMYAGLWRLYVFVPAGAVGRARWTAEAYFGEKSPYLPKSQAGEA